MTRIYSDRLGRARIASVTSASVFSVPSSGFSRWVIRSVSWKVSPGIQAELYLNTGPGFEAFDGVDNSAGTNYLYVVRDMHQVVEPGEDVQVEPLTGTLPLQVAVIVSGYKFTS